MNRICYVFYSLLLFSVHPLELSLIPEKEKKLEICMYLPKLGNY